jgi:hypothetical protein
MNRVWDYFSFAVWFAGLGYIVLWLFGSPEHLILPPALHIIGVASAMFVPVRLLFRTNGRRRVRAAAMPAAHARTPAAVLRPRRRRPECTLRSVKPRSHFGLRGVPE